MTAAVRRFSGSTMGTNWVVSILESKHIDPASDLVDAIECLFRELISAMSTWDDTSEISRFNRSTAGTWHSVSRDFMAVLERAISYAELTGGAFDPTVGSITTMHHDNSVATTSGVPSCGYSARWKELEIHSSAGKIRQPGGIALDLSAIAKGYAVDCLAGLLFNRGNVSFLAEIGGEFVGRGTKPDGQPWWVLLETPPGDENNVLPTVIALYNCAVATSGNYRRFRYTMRGPESHLIDPTTGQSVNTAVVSVSVIHAQCMDADALATALAVLGIKDGMNFANEHRIAARFIAREDGQLREYLTDRMAELAK